MVVPELEPTAEAVPAEEIPVQAGNDGKVVEEPAVVPEPDPTPVASDPTPVAPEPAEEIPAQAGKVKTRKWLRILLIVLGVVVALLLLFALLSRIAPGLLDPLLYSKEELQILRY